MHVGYMAVLLLLATGCAHGKPDTVPEPPIVATPPDAPVPVVATKPVTPARPPTTPAAAPAPSARTPAALDLNTLKEELKDTKAIGFFTKVTLKNQVDDLLDQFREFYEGKAKLTLTDLRRSYELLIMKVLSLLQDADQKLASAIVSSREAIWGLLADRTTFANLQG